MFRNSNSLAATDKQHVGAVFHASIYKVLYKNQ